MAILGGGERDLTIRLFANVKDFTKNMDDATKNTQAFSGKAIETLGKVGLAVGAAAAAVAGFAVKLGVDSVKAAIEAQKQQERLAILLRNTGGATEEQIQTLNAQAIALSKVGVATRDNVTITQSQLATFDLKAGTIAKLTPAILDYVVAEKGATASTDDFRSMTNGLAQALQGNFASLTATGFVLDEATKATIKNGTETERTAALVDVLNSTYKGFNETIGETAEGQLIRLQNAFEDTKVKIGEALLPFVLELFEAFREKLLPKITEFTDFIIEKLIPAIDTYLRPRIERLIETFGGLATAFDETTNAVVPTRDGINIFTRLIQEISLSVFDGFLNVINGIGIAITELTRILGFFAVFFTTFDLDKAIAVLNFEQHKLNNTVGDAQREFLKYQQQLDTTTNSLAAAYRELKFYNNFKKEIALPTTKTETELLQEQIETLKAQLEAVNAAGEGSKRFAAAQNQAANAVKQLTALQRELNALQAGGAIPSSLSPDMTAFFRSELGLISQFGGLIGGINLNPDDPFFGFGQGSSVNQALRQRAGGSATATGGVTINVTGTVIDPEGAARAIEQLIIDSNARGGELIPFGGSP
jgi:hypothetical protein